jgi:predicted Fe-S protein YdhL (DUF1289 family)
MEIKIIQTRPITSPCISNCCLDEEDICMGCFRHIDEITGWHSADNKRREEIIVNTLNRKTKNK